MKKPNFRSLALLSLLVFAGCASQCPATNQKAKVDSWIGCWVSAQQLTEPNNMPPAVFLHDATLRQIVQPAISGHKVRITVSNLFGHAPLSIDAACVARSATGDAIAPESNQYFTFNGSRAVIVPAGASLISDPVDFEVTALTNLAISVHVQSAPAEVTGHPGSRTTSFLCSGNSVVAAALPEATKVDHWYFLSHVEVLPNQPASAIVVLGDSITDGRGSTTNLNDRWPNQLSRRLLANPATRSITVLNQGIGGNRLLGDGLGPSALARFDRDVLAQPRVRWLIVLEGVNDLGTAKREENKPSTIAQDIIAAYEQIILRAKAHHLTVLGATILPGGGSFYSNPGFEADRQTVNQWIRTSGKFDAIIDFDLATRDPADVSHLTSAVDGGDHLHPSANGYKIMADAIDLKLFLN
jgi:lysophospholipase L1-like esterase